MKSIFIQGPSAERAVTMTTLNADSQAFEDIAGLNRGGRRILQSSAPQLCSFLFLLCGAGRDEGNHACQVTPA